jgi:hypothetical protein
MTTMTQPPRTPRKAELLLEALGARSDFRDALLGDLAEEHAVRAERDGAAAARRWYYREAIRAAPYLLRDWSRHLRARDVAHLAGIALTSLVFVEVLGALVGVVVVALLDAAPDSVRLIGLACATSGAPAPRCTWSGCWSSE